jgi:hypothetical protein
MKKCGLWRFHREARAVRERTGNRWWVDDELEAVYNGISYSNISTGWNNKITNANLITKCAKRFCSLYSVPLRTVADWHTVVEYIAQKSGLEHSSTMKALRIDRGRDKSPLRWYLGRKHDEFSLPHAMPMDYLRKRADNIAEARRKRIDWEQRTFKPCRWCGAVIRFKESWLDANKTIRCNDKECRRIDYLSRICKTHGGIDLTPTQEKAIPRQY